MRNTADIIKSVVGIVGLLHDTCWNAPWGPFSLSAPTTIGHITHVPSCDLRFCMHGRTRLLISLPALAQLWHARGEMAPVTLPSRCFRTRLPVTRRHLELMPANVSQHTQAGTPGFWPWIIESSGTRENIAGGSAAGPPTSFVCLQKLDSSGGRGHITVHCPFRRRYSSVKPLTPMYHKAGLHTEIFAERAFEDRSSSLCWWRWFTLRW